MPCRYDVVVALDHDIKRDIIKMVQPEWHSYYDAKVCMLDQFSDYLGSDILKTGGTAVLESELSDIIKPVMEESKAIPELLRPSLHKGACHPTPVITHSRVFLVLTVFPSPGWRVMYTILETAKATLLYVFDKHGAGVADAIATVAIAVHFACKFGTWMIVQPMV